MTKFDSEERPSGISITVSLTVMMLALAMILGGVLIVMNHQRNTEAALLAAEDVLDGIAVGVAARTREILQPMIAAASITSELDIARLQPGALSLGLERYLTKLLRAMPRITSLYYGFPDGEFVQYVDLQEHRSWSPRELSPPGEASFVRRWVFDDPAKGRLDTVEYLDEDLSVLASETAHGVYDPRKRPWYRQAMAMDSVIATSPYIFASSREIGVTVARRVDEGRLGVFGVDVTFASLSAFLKTELPSSDSLVALIDQHGRVLASPEKLSIPSAEDIAAKGAPNLLKIDMLKNPLAGPVAEYTDAGRQLPQLLEIAGRTYVAKFKSLLLPIGGEEKLVMVVPAELFTERITKLGRDSLLTSIAILLLSIPVIVALTHYIARSLRKLATETEAIRDFRLEGAVTVRSRIREIADLAEAMDRMKGALRTFGFYLPRGLVRQMVENRITPELGGERRDITVLFTDIAGFTSIAEALEPEVVMRRMSDYFEVLTASLRDHGGVIDKFIGDAVMAEWNAIVEDPDHVATACRAVLHARNAVREFNLKLNDQGLEPMRTRFGLNTGQAVVGNVGSTERMDFTALGATVNLVHRLIQRVHEGAEDIVLFRAPATRPSSRGAERRGDPESPPESANTQIAALDCFVATLLLMNMPLSR